MFGTGLRERPTGLSALAIAQMAAWAVAGSPVLAMDIPSGLLADSSACDGPSVVATATVALACPKPAHILAPACDRVGELVIADIGIPARILGEVAPQLFLLEGDDAAALLSAAAPGGAQGQPGTRARHRGLLRQDGGGHPGRHGGPARRGRPGDGGHPGRGASPRRRRASRSS